MGCTPFEIGEFAGSGELLQDTDGVAKVLCLLGERRNGSIKDLQDHEIRIRKNGYGHGRKLRNNNIS